MVFNVNREENGVLHINITWIARYRKKYIIIKEYTNAYISLQNLKKPIITLSCFAFLKLSVTSFLKHNVTSNLVTKEKSSIEQMVKADF